MFAKVSVLSLFVFCLFTLGQAAPILDDADISSITSREAPSSLVTRGFFHKIFHKVDAATQKQIDTVAVSAECKMHDIHMQAQKAFITAQQDMTKEKDKLVVKDNKSKDVLKEFKKRIKTLTASGKEASKKLKKSRSALKKLGVDEKHCKSVATGSTD